MSTATNFDLHVFRAPWDAMQADLKFASDRATMFALRATGRAVVRAARSAAPVYSGDDPRAIAESGQLRRSIKSGRTIRRSGGVYELHVMPTGNSKKGTAVHQHTSGGGLRGVPLYRRQVNDMYGFMQAGINTGLADAQATYEGAYAKAFAKYAP